MIYLVHSKQSLLVEKEIKRILKTHIKEINEFSYVSYDLTQTLLEDIIEDAKTLPFMVENKAILVKNSYIFTGSKDKMNHDIKALEDYVEHESPSTVLIFCLYEDALDERKSLVKLARKKFIIRKIEETSKNDWPILVKKVLVNHKIDITNEATQYLIDCSNNDLNKVSNEITKFELYGEKITLEVAKALVSQPLEDNAFGIADALLNHDVETCLSIYQDLRIQNEEPVRLIATIANQVRFIYQVNVLYRKGYVREESIAKELGASPYRVKLAIKKIRVATPERLLNILHELSKLDVDIKSGKVDRFQGFELFLLKDL